MTPTTDAERSPRVDVLLVMQAFADQGLQVCCGLGHGGGMDENGNGEPPSCCGQPITSDDMRDALELVSELLAADLALDAGQQAIEEFWEQGEPGFVPNQERVAELAANFYGAVARRTAALEAMSLNQEPRT